MSYSGEVFKNVVKPYYKYKQEAYNSIRGLAIRLLTEGDYFVRNPISPENVRITFGNNLDTSIPGCVIFFVNGTHFFDIVGTRVVGSRKYNFRENLTTLEHERFSRDLAELFKCSGSTTIPAFLGGRVHYWEVNKDYCEFIGNGIRFLNKD